MALPTWFVRTVELALAISFVLVVLKIVYSLWIWPNMVYKKLRRNGLIGPSPSFPLGNIKHMVAAKNKRASALSSCTTVSHDIYSKVVPHFAEWQESHGKVFIYWLGTEPFLRIADPEFLKQMASAVLGNSWGKPDVFRIDRKAMFGNGIVMLEGDDWLRHRNVITPAFSPANLKAMGSLMVASTNEMLDRWTSIINSGSQEIEVESEIIATTGEIIAKTSFGMDYNNGKKVFHKLRTMQQVLFASNRYVGVPFNNFFCYKEYCEAKRLGDEIDALFLTIIKNKIKSREAGARVGITNARQEKNLLDLMLADKDCRRTLTTVELVDECKTFFFAGFETTALALIWTLMLLAMYPEWTNQLREEIKQVIGDQVVDATNIFGLKKMGWVMSEALRLYPSAVNAQRQVREDIRVGEVVIPKGTNIWIDMLSMNHDRGLWGDTVNEFRPERFEADSVHGGCLSKMGYVPFGIGGRMCIGRNLAIMEYKIVLTLILTRFSFSLSPYYQHSPVHMLSLRPCKGLPLVFQPIN
ncbi:hypothetical protein DCAR_0626185 [Daucus carota subsp. sativus]|uniref:Cytochrome P450 n=1 Tax=Daucus carota subsp. sativus TaxID=79200 RepID=A0AAF1B7J5_DAUCS|nr:PREDICTED: cytokinin hydroxylase-like [Daucus carota subsp. sativus]WOH06757.1 hypothetical protein DCAR_0626185 [Daucus carota subsp. sativus]